jgi:hypothetical protein
MSVLAELASSLGRNDERPNVELAEKLAQSGDTAAIAELVAALGGKPDIASDAIKTLYEIGERRPELITEHAEAFLAALKSKNNRMAWGGMAALDTIVGIKPDLLARRLTEILVAAETGSVITRDKAVSILCKLIASGHNESTGPALLLMLTTAALNQLPSYAEAAAAALPPPDRPKLAAIITARLPDVPQPAKRARLEKVLRKLEK